MKQLHFHSICILILNLIIITLFIFSWIFYNTKRNTRIIENNKESIKYITKARADVVEVFFTNQQNMLESICEYIDTAKYTENEASCFIKNFTEKGNITYQLIELESFTGFSIPSKEHLSVFVDYSDSSYRYLQNRLKYGGKSGLTSEFTDYTSEQVVAFYNKCSIYNLESLKQMEYVLLQTFNPLDVLTPVTEIPAYINSTTAIIHGDGTYILKKGIFRNTNLFSFLDQYNDPTKKQKDKYRQYVADNPRGSIEYVNSNQEKQWLVFEEIDKNGKYYFIVSIPFSSLVLRTSGIHVYVFLLLFCSIFIVTNLKFLLRVNKKLKSSLLKAEVMNNAKTEFLSRMSHDMRTPMNCIIGMTDLTLAHSNIDEKVRENIVLIKNSGKYLLSLINDTLDMNKIESNKMTLNYKPVLVETLLHSLIASQKFMAEQKGIDFYMKTVNLEKENYISTDPVRLQQVFINLLSNAIKFTPPGGSISVSLEVLKRTSTSVYDRFTIKDTGIGISSDFLPKVFESFEQENNSEVILESGTGLGLAIVKKIVEMMNGIIKIESEKGKGTTVTVELPFTIVEKVNIDKIEEKNYSVFNGKKVLLVDDHPLNLKIAQSLLESRGFIVQTAVNGVEAVKMMSEQAKYLFDCILMDLRMPIMDGITASKKIRNLDILNTSTIPIIAMTADVFKNNLEIVKNAGMNDFISKPIDTNILFSTLLKYFNDNTK